MTKILSSSIYDKKVVSSDGGELGELKDIVTDVNTGQLIDLVVDPDMSVETGKYRSEDGYVLLPFDSVKAIKDHIIVEAEHSKTEARATKA